MKILVKFPTRGRREKFFSTLDIYQKNLSDTGDVNFLITLDEDDPDMNQYSVINRLSSYKNLTYVLGYSSSKVDAVNRDMSTIEDWDIVLLASDDMIPKYKGYDEIIVHHMTELYPDTDGILFFNDGFQKNKINTLSIMGRKYYDRFNYIYFPEYRSAWCDNEFTTVGNILGKQTYIDKVIIQHEHPDWGYGKHDIIHKNNYRDYNYDKNLYYSRKKINFGL